MRLFSRTTSSETNTTCSVPCDSPSERERYEEIKHMLRERQHRVAQDLHYLEISRKLDELRREGNQ